MNLKENIFCFVPAKFASTRLPHKNILSLNGKEMMGYALEAAQSSKLFGQNIIVSTESETVKSVAEKYGASVPYLREAKLASDPYGIVEVLLDFFDGFSEYKKFKNVMIVLPTAPLITAEDITSAYQKFQSSDCQYLMSVTESDHSALRSCFVRDSTLKPLFPNLVTKKSQELENTYRINGAIAILDVEDFLNKKSYFQYPLEVYIMPKDRSIDVDTQFDFELAEFLLKKKY